MRQGSWWRVGSQQGSYLEDFLRSYHGGAASQRGCQAEIRVYHFLAQRGWEKKFSKVIFSVRRDCKPKG